MNLPLIYGRIFFASIFQISIRLLPLLALLYSLGCQPKPLTTAKIHIQNKDWESAVEELEGAVEAYPENSEAHFLLGVTYGNSSRYEDMNREFGIAWQISERFVAQIDTVRKRHWNNEYTAGIQALDDRNYEAAEKHLKAAIVINSTHLEAHNQLALNYVESERIDDALAIYTQLLQKYPRNLQLLNSAGSLYYKEKRFEEAVVLLRKALAIDSNNRHAGRDLALSLQSLGEFDEASHAFQNAIKSFPQDRELIFLFGVHQYKRHQFEKAIQVFERILEVDPNDFDAASNIGNAYLSIAEELRKELKQASNGPVAANEIQTMRDRAIFSYKQAIPYLKKAIRLQPNIPNLWRNLGVAYIQTGERENGEEAFLRSEELQIKLSN